LRDEGRYTRTVIEVVAPYISRAGKAEVSQMQRLRTRDNSPVVIVGRDGRIREPDAHGSRNPPYEILAPIGAGGMREVWKAHDTRLNRTVAINFLKPESA
jgi:serine/threonine protein kinase